MNVRRLVQEPRTKNQEPRANRTWFLLLGSWFLVLGSCLALGSTDDTAADEQLLQKAQIGTDGPALVAYFRQRTVGDAERQRIEALIRQLGDPAYAVRERAQTELIACG